MGTYVHTGFEEGLRNSMEVVISMLLERRCYPPTTPQSSSLLCPSPFLLVPFATHGTRDARSKRRLAIVAFAYTEAGTCERANRRNGKYGNWRMIIVAVANSKW